MNVIDTMPLWVFGPWLLGAAVSAFYVILAVGFVVAVARRRVAERRIRRRVAEQLAFGAGADLGQTIVTPRRRTKRSTR